MHKNELNDPLKHTNLAAVPGASRAGHGEVSSLIVGGRRTAHLLFHSQFLKSNSPSLFFRSVLAVHRLSWTR
jgi:hypothetical protein